MKARPHREAAPSRYVDWSERPSFVWSLSVAGSDGLNEPHVKDIETNTGSFLAPHPEFKNGTA